MSSSVSYIFLKVDGYTSFIFKSIFNAAKDLEKVTLQNNIGEINGKVYINDEIKARIEEYYSIYGA